jgi:hypothetical protein
MRCWRAISLWVIAGLTAGCGGGAPDAGLRVTGLEAVPAGDGYRVTVSLDIMLTDAVLEALHNGVPVTLLVETRLRQPREWLWARTVASDSRRYILTYQSLSTQYLVEWPGDTGHRAYPSRHAAFSALESPEAWRLEPDHDPGDGDALLAEARARLDLQALPAPLSLVAFFSGDWRIGSGWHREKLPR